MQAGKSSRRSSALMNAASRRMSFSAPVNLQALVRVYFLDGSSKVLQMHEKSTVEDVLLALKFNLDLSDISCFALFSVQGAAVHRLDLKEVVAEKLKSAEGSGSPEETKLLFRSWIQFRYGGFDNEVFQYGRRLKSPNSALWLAYMEASFSCLSGLYFLTEDESLLLGCLKMQAEMGDFDSRFHSVEGIKARVVNRFPNPIRAKMKALCSATLGGTNLSNELAGRVQAMYAHLAGKSKCDAQIDFLNTLRTWSPFYGASFFNVQCQYDESPLDPKSSPPTLPMRACVCPLAIILTSADEPPAFLRHAYSRIVRWTAHADKHIFVYWVLKPGESIPEDSDGEEESENRGKTSRDADEDDKGGIGLSKSGHDLRALCDCVYLVSEYVNEIQHLVKSYLRVASDIPPSLPGATGDLLAPASPNQAGSSTQPDEEEEAEAPSPSQKAMEQLPARRASAFARLGSFFSGGSSTPTAAGAGLANAAVTKNIRQQGYGDDTAAVSNSVFKLVFASVQSDEAQAEAPSSTQFVGSIGDLQRMASKASFSDSEDEGGNSRGGSASSKSSDGGGESDESGDEDSDSG